MAEDVPRFFFLRRCSQIFSNSNFLNIELLESANAGKNYLRLFPFDVIIVYYL